MASRHDYALTISASSLQNIPAEGGVINSRIEATNAVSWEITGLPDWLSASTLKGTGSQDVSFKSESNTSLTSSRTQIFNIVTSNPDWALTIPVSATQQKMKKSLSVSPPDNASLTFAASGGTKSIAVTSNVAWKAECSDKFVQLSQTSASSDANIIITVNSYDEIDVTQNRTAHIYFKDAMDGEALQVITITQTPLQTSITTENIDVQFDPQVNAKDFKLGTIGGTYSVSSNAAWLGISKNTATGQIDVTISAEANNNDDERSTTAYVYLDANKSIKYVFNIKQKGNYINVTPSSLSFLSTGGTESVDVTTPSDWNFTNNNDWLTVTKNANTCKLTAKENNTFTDRKGTVSFSRIDGSGSKIGKSISVSIDQEGRHITTNVESVQFGPDASMKQLTIDCDAAWTISPSESWISLSSTSGNGNADVNISVQKNESQASRTGTVLLKCLDKTIPITINQSSAYLNTTSTAISFDAKGGSSTVSLSSNSTWSASSSESWLIISPQTGSGDGTITMNATENVTDSPRAAIITIQSIAGTVKLNVMQDAPTLSLSVQSLTFAENGGTSNPIVITTDYSYQIVASAPWLTYSQTDNTFTVTASKNTLSSRTGTITVSLTGIIGILTRTVSVYQKGDDTPYVDLGLPSGTKWASYNEGASSVGGLGSLFTGSQSDNYNCPTETQAMELINNCKWTSTIINNINGVSVTGSNGNSIFFPNYINHTCIWVKGAADCLYQKYLTWYTTSSGTSANIYYCSYKDQNTIPIREVR